MNCSMGYGLNPEYLATKLSELAERLTTDSPGVAIPLPLMTAVSDAIFCASDEGRVCTGTLLADSRLVL